MNDSGPLDEGGPIIDLGCAAQAAALGVNPRGTATRCTTLVLVEHGGAWPARIEDLDEIAALPPLPAGHRILTTRGSTGQNTGDQHTGGQRTGDRAVLALTPALSVWRAGDDLAWSGIDYELGSDRLASAVAALAAGDAPDRVDGVDAIGPAPTEVLICGHGQRDTCCGKLGIPVLREAEARVAAGAWPGVRVRRCSHTGGHRFAPTGITLPDGRFWAFLDIDVLDAAVTGRDEPRLPNHNRGLAALQPLAQVAEAALFDEIGPSWLQARPEIDDPTDGPGRGAGADGAAVFRFSWGDADAPQSATVTVRQTGTTPTPPCGLPVDQATKSSPIFEVVAIDW